MGTYHVEYLTSAQQLSPEMVAQVRQGHWAAVVIDGFYPADCCQRVVAALLAQKETFFRYRQENTDAYAFGNPLNPLSSRASGYFAEVESKYRNIRKLFHDLDCEYPLDKIIHLLESVWGAGAKVAQNENGQQFYAGDIRFIGTAPLHNDFAARDESAGALKAMTEQLTSELRSITEQLSWNLYLSASDAGGGQLELWNRRWQQADEAYRLPGTLMGYDDQVVANCDRTWVEPKPGRFVILRSTSYHRVLPSEDAFDRISMTSFIGVRDDAKPLLLWS
ncbi:MAG: 2OG-Fe(II) oxygenase [Cyanobacteria bacterium P01_A01_bin.105]